MRIAGIICEYNPFHNGHLYQISETRRLLGEDTAVVCVMSGNFVQRGEPAVFSKHVRAAAAAMCGADLVLELPVQAALSSAEGFAWGGVKLLESTGICTHLSFGAECGDISSLSRTAECLLSPETDTRLKELLGHGLSYAAARQQAAAEKLGEQALLLQKPNNILAVEYLKAVKRTGNLIEPTVIARTGEGHDASSGSGLAIRRKMISGEPWKSEVPQTAAELFVKEIADGRAPVTSNNMEQAMLYRLRTMKREDFTNLPGGGDGLGDKVFKAVREGNSVEEITAMAKSRRHALSRIRRLLLCAYLNLTESELMEEPGYIRVLAIGERGRELLKTMKEKASLPVITKPADGKALPGIAGRQFARDAALTDLYSLARPGREWNACGDEYRTTPFVWKKEDSWFENGNI